MDKQSYFYIKVKKRLWNELKQNNNKKPPVQERNFGLISFRLFCLASKTWFGSVLFLALAFTGAKLASGVPAVMRRFGPRLH